MNRGVYTIEAAIWVSLLLFIFMAAIGTGLTLYKEATQQEVSTDVEDYWAVSAFYTKNGIEEVLDD